MQTPVETPDDLSIRIERGWIELQVGLSNDNKITNSGKLRFRKTSQCVVGFVEHHDATNEEELEKK